MFAAAGHTRMPLPKARLLALAPSVICRSNSFNGLLDGIILRTLDQRDEPDEYALAHDLSLKPGCSIGIPDGLVAAGEHNTDRDAVDAHAVHMSKNSTLPQPRNDLLGIFSQHRDSVASHVPESLDVLVIHEEFINAHNGSGRCHYCVHG